MGHYAKVNKGIVTKVIVADESFIVNYNDKEEGEWIKTSFNTRGGIHYKANTNEPSKDQSKALRKNYAGVGFIYDSKMDAFYTPQPFDSWKLNKDTCLWEAPIDYPTDGEVYVWNEETLNWE